MINIEEMKNVDIRNVDKSLLVERSTIKIDPNAPREQKLQDYIKQIKNPYCYLDDDTVVKLSFAKTDVTMEDCFAHYLKGS